MVSLKWDDPAPSLTHNGDNQRHLQRIAMEMSQCASYQQLAISRQPK
jgi:hypothetical protein